MRRKKKLPFGLRMAKVGFEQSKEPIQVGAALLEGGSITISFNEKKSSPAAKQNGYMFENSLHAELKLFAHRNTPANKATVYVYRALKDGTLAIARPCTDCMTLIKCWGVKRVVYTIQDGWQKEKI